VIGLAEVDGRTAADVVHRRMTTLPASATVGDLRAYFAESESHHLAVLVDGARYVGSLTPADLPADDAAAAADFARPGPTIAASTPAGAARDAALADPSARLPVVDADGALVGVVAINDARDGFCGT
jgi:CBS-domain-containing membrane protein